MHGYEAMLSEVFPKLGFLNASVNSNPNFGTLRKRAIRFLEMTCSSTYGFPGEVHFFDENKKPINMIPALYETAFLLSILCEEADVNPAFINTLATVVANNKRSSGFWNYFLLVEDKSALLFPDDLDDTVLCIMGLYKTGKMSLEECQIMAKQVLAKVVFNQNGEMSAWLKVEELKKHHVLYKGLLSNIRIDLGTIVNTLWLFSSIDMDTDNQLMPSANFVHQFVDNLILTQENHQEMLSGMLYYTNRFFIYFLISRYVSSSQHARTAFGEKFALLVRDEILKLKTSENALNIASMSLAAITLKLHTDKPQFPLSKEDSSKIFAKLKILAELLLGLQNMDGSFAACNAYQWFRIGEYGGSRWFTTSLVLSAISKLSNDLA